MSEPGPSSPSARHHKQKRLSKEAIAFLTNYASVINSYPQSEEKQSILASIHSIPGNEWYTTQRLSSWFARHRNPSPSSALPLAAVDEETILFPKLTPKHLQQLRLLYKKRTDPAENIITFWAERINADRHEVIAWFQYQQEKAKGNQCHQSTPDSPDIPLQQLVRDLDGSEGCASPTVLTRPRTHLPTPSQSPSESPHERMPSLPPIAVKLEEPRQCLSPISLVTPISAHPLHALRPSHSTSFRAGAQLSRDSSRLFAATVRKSLRDNPAQNDPPPKTPDEFAAKFVTFEKMIDAFMEKHKSGQLARLGWDPNVCSAGS